MARICAHQTGALSYNRTLIFAGTPLCLSAEIPLFILLKSRGFNLAIISCSFLKRILVFVGVFFF